MSEQGAGRAHTHSVLGEGVFLISLCCLLVLHGYRQVIALGKNTSLEAERVPAAIVEVEGDVQYRGVCFFNQVPTLGEILCRGGESVGPPRSSSVNLDVIVPTGTTINVTRMQGIRSITAAPMDPEKLIMFEIPLSLNTANRAALSGLRGIGPSLARAIVAYRKEHGIFKNLDELKRIKGIGEKKFRGMQKYLVVTTPPSGSENLR